MTERVIAQLVDDEADAWDEWDEIIRQEEAEREEKEHHATRFGLTKNEVASD